MSRKAAFTVLHIVCAFLILFSKSYTADTFTSNLNITNGEVAACPGDIVSFTCAHDDNFTLSLTIWKVAGAVACSAAAVHANTADIMCGPFTINMISGVGGSVLSSTLQIPATQELNGIMVQCRDSTGPNANQIGNVTVNVLDIPTPNVTTLEQVSQSDIRASVAVDNTQCVARYLIKASPVGGSGSISFNSTSTTLDISGLNVCQYNYSVNVSTITAGGVWSGVSSPVTFTADLSVVNGVKVTINQADPLLVWTQMENILYPTCITDYIVSSGGISTTVNSTVMLLTTRQLNAAGFLYCETLQPTVTPLTPMGRLESAGGNDSVVPRDPKFVPPVLTPSYTLVNETVTLRITIQDISDTVVPNRTYQYTNNVGAVSPMISFNASYFGIEVEAEQTVPVTVMFQNMLCVDMTSANFTIPSREITDVTPDLLTDTSHTVTITLPLIPYQPEELLIISTVEPSNGNPIMANFSRPAMQYSVTFDNLMADTSYTFTVRIVFCANTTVDVVPAAIGSFTTLITPTTTPPPTTMAPTTTFTQPHTQPTTAPQGGGCGVGCIAGIIIGFLIVLLILVVIVAIIPCYWNKKRKPKVSSQEMEQQRTLTTNDGEEVDSMANIPEYPPASESDKLGPVYEDPDAFKVDPHTQDNLAYGHIQQSAQLKGPIYEDIKPDPHTQGNLAYGHVQFN